MYRIYGSVKKGYEDISTVKEEEAIYNKLDPLVENKEYKKYLIIEHINNMDIPYGIFYDEKSYEELKEEKVKKLVK